MSNTTILFTLVGILALGGCTSETASSPPAPEKVMFDTPAGNSTANQLLGVWDGGEQKVADVTAITRWEVRADHLVLGMKCTNATATEIVGGQVKAAVSDALIDVKEPAKATKTIGQVVCGVQMTAGQLPACDPKAAESTYNVCFLVKDKTMTLYQGGPTKKQVFTKVAD